MTGTPPHLNRWNDKSQRKFNYVSNYCNNQISDALVPQILDVLTVGSVAKTNHLAMAVMLVIVVLWKRYEHQKSNRKNSRLHIDDVLILSVGGEFVMDDRTEWGKQEKVDIELVYRTIALAVAIIAFFAFVFFPGISPEAAKWHQIHVIDTSLLVLYGLMNIAFLVGCYNYLNHPIGHTRKFWFFVILSVIFSYGI